MAATILLDNLSEKVTTSTTQAIADIEKATVEKKLIRIKDVTR